MRKTTKMIVASLMAAVTIAPAFASIAPMTVSAGQVLGETSFDHKALPWHTCESSPAKQNFKIEDGAYKVYDVDYNSDGKYINNRVVMNLSDNFLYENLKPEVTVIWGIENNEWCVQPKVNYKVADGMNLGVSGGVLYCYNENGEFYNFTADSTKWHTKSFVQASVRYEF